MKTVWYFYYSDGAANPGFDSPWMSMVPGNRYIPGATQDGIYQAILRAVGHKYKVVLVIESARGLGMNDLIWVPPHISKLEGFIGDRDICVFRGGWKSWIGTVNRIREKGIPVLFYGANTGNERWGLWDYILDDRIEKNVGNRLAFIKPIYEPIFKDIFCKRTLDVMIGASHIHPKKGQYQVLEALDRINSRLGGVDKLKIIMPGGMRDKVNNKEIIGLCKQNDIIIGNFTRAELAKRMCMTKIIIHNGTSGQGDRGLYEALNCGCVALIKSPRLFAPWISKNPHTIRIIGDDLETEIVRGLSDCKEGALIPDSYWYRSVNGLEIAAERMGEIIELVESKKEVKVNV